MGYFGLVYVVVCADDADGLTLETSVLTPALGTGRALLFWSDGERPRGLFSYADGSLQSTSKLSLLPGYPAIQRLGNGVGASRNAFLIEEDFQAQSPDEPVLFHFLLPPRFVPCPDRDPLITPSRPSIVVRDDLLSVTFVATGAADVRFWIKRLAADESLNDFDLTRLFNKPLERSVKATIEINLGFVKFTFGDA